MRLRNIKNAKKIINDSKYTISNLNDYKGKWQLLFNNNNPIYIEIGMGKGSFIFESALKYPNINFIGIEKYDKVIVRAIKKIEPYELNNLKLIRLDAINLEEVFFKEIDCIYLNFSDPWSKDKYIKRRLTSDIFLNIYDNIFKKQKKIYFKTDNIDFYDFSKEQFKRHKYKIETISYNFNNIPEDNIMTEYEEKFLNDNKIIYKINAIK